MKQRSKRSLRSLLAASTMMMGLAAATTLVATPPLQAQPAPTTGPAAEVNDEKIMRADLERLVSSFREREPALGTGSEQAKATLEDIRQQQLENLIQQRLLAQEARRLKIVPKPEEVDKAMIGFKSTLPNEAAFQDMLTKSGKSAADVRRLIAEELAIRELSKRLTADVTVPESEIAAVYKSSPDDFKIEEMQAHHILFMLKPGSPPAERARQLNRLQTVLKLAQAKGADFEKLARQYSEDPTAKANGGNLGTFERRQMVESFSNAAFKLPVGKVVGPVETEYGLHIVRVNAKPAPRMVPLAQVRETIQMVLLKQKVQQRLEQKVKQLRAAAKIKKYV